MYRKKQKNEFRKLTEEELGNVFGGNSVSTESCEDGYKWNPITSRCEPEIDKKTGPNPGGRGDDFHWGN